MSLSFSLSLSLSLSLSFEMREDASLLCEDRPLSRGIYRGFYPRARQRLVRSFEQPSLEFVVSGNSARIVAAFARAAGNRAITRAKREAAGSLRSEFLFGMSDFAPVNSGDSTVVDLRHRKRHRRYRGRSRAVDIPANLCRPFFADTPD